MVESMWQCLASAMLGSILGVLMWQAVTSLPKKR